MIQDVIIILGVDDKLQHFDDFSLLFLKDVGSTLYKVFDYLFIGTLHVEETF